MQIIPIEVFNFARMPGVNEQHRQNAIRIAQQCLKAGTSKGAAYLAGKRYLRNVGHQGQGGAA
jgi:predicted HD phosphohydrolase